MPAAAVVTLIGVALTVAALAIYLIRIVFILRHVNFTLGTIIAAIHAIANQTQPLGAVMNDINTDLDNVRRSLEEVVAKAQRAQAQPAGRGRTRRGAGREPVKAPQTTQESRRSAGTKP